MTNTTSNLMKGIGVGMLVGGATALIGGSMKNSKKMKIKKDMQKFGITYSHNSTLKKEQKEKIIKNYQVKTLIQVPDLKDGAVSSKMLIQTLKQTYSNQLLNILQNYQKLLTQDKKNIKSSQIILEQLHLPQQMEHALKMQVEDMYYVDF